MTLQDLALSPLYLAQAALFIARTEKLPEAAGPRAGQSGQGAPLRLLVLGDSSGAGVGVAHQDQALIGQMLHHLEPERAVTWQVIARSGATTAQARQMQRGADPCDVAVLALGVNDVLRQTSRARFAGDYAALMSELPARHILASAVPPLGDFTAFPAPLRGFLGRRASALDTALQDLCAQTGALHVPFDLDPDPKWLARDGLHPGGALYAEWGRRMAGLALAQLS
ncbi:MAG: SGNH/GDSL hydrolase family protein [Roseinatronobacter sp.]